MLHISATRFSVLAMVLCSFMACSDDEATSGSPSGAVGSGGAGTGGDGGGDASGGAGSGGAPTTFGGDRPVEVLVPDAYDPNVPAPLVILLHGYGASGVIQNAYFGLGALANERGALFASPDGTLDPSDQQFWNATDACCDFAGSGVDDSGYLRQLVEDIRAAYNIDPKRIHFVGHSNGGFMSYRMACDHADLIASIASLAGATFADPGDCTPSEPVHVLQIHGTADETIAYDGAIIGSAAFPGAVESAETWAGTAGCSLTSSPGTPLDLDSALTGDETTVARYTEGCDPGGSAELWTIAGGGHIPSLTSSFAPAVLDFLLGHPKP